MELNCFMMRRRIRIGSLSSPNFEIWNDKIDRSRQSFRCFVPMFSVQNKTFWALFIARPYSKRPS